MTNEQIKHLAKIYAAADNLTSAVFGASEALDGTSAGIDLDRLDDDDEMMPLFKIKQIIASAIGEETIGENPFKSEYPQQRLFSETVFKIRQAIDGVFEDDKTN